MGFAFYPVNGGDPLEMNIGGMIWYQDQLRDRLGHDLKAVGFSGYNDGSKITKTRAAKVSKLLRASVESKPPRFNTDRDRLLRFADFLETSGGCEIW